MKALALYAGPRAHQWITSNGLSARDVAAVPAAAGGPKGLILGPLDRFIFGDWLPTSDQPVDLIGASIGAWRMATACLDHPKQAFLQLQNDYIGQDYEIEPGKKRPTAAHVSHRFRQSLIDFFDDQVPQVVNHHRYRLHLVTARGRHLLQKERPWSTPFGFAAAYACNLGHRRGLGWWLERVVFSSAGAQLPFANDGMPTRQVGLTPENFQAALQASCSIPFVLQSVVNIPGAPKGAYWDGGLTDYHLHLDYRPLADFGPTGASGQLVVYPHFQQRAVPGWLDKALKWRHAATPFLENMLVLAPRPEWIAQLPNGKLPDRTDFTNYSNDQAARMKVWRQACAASEQLADEFQQWLANPDVSAIEPL